MSDQVGFERLLLQTTRPDTYRRHTSAQVGPRLHTHVDLHTDDRTTTERLERCPCGVRQWRRQRGCSTGISLPPTPAQSGFWDTSNLFPICQVS